MSNEEILQVVEELKFYDKDFEQHLKDLVLLAKNFPNQYTLAIVSLKGKVAKFKIK